MESIDIFAIIWAKIKKLGAYLKGRIDNIEDGARFLSLWNAATGLPLDDPEESSYDYSRGMFFIVANIDDTEENKEIKKLVKIAQDNPSAANINKLTKAVKKFDKKRNGTNYKPSGTSYTPGVPSTVVETEDVNIGDKYWYSGVSWQLQQSSSAETFFSNIRGNATDNTSLATALNNKLDKVTTTTSGSQLYAKLPNGNQSMISIDSGASNGTIMYRTSDGRSKVKDPSDNLDIVNKQTMDSGLSNKLDKITTTTTYAQAYMKAENGTQTVINLRNANAGSSLMLRDSNGRAEVSDPVNNLHCVNKQTLDSGLSAKQDTLTDTIAISGVDKTTGDTISYDVYIES